MSLITSIVNGSKVVSPVTWDLNWIYDVIIGLSLIKQYFTCSFIDSQVTIYESNYYKP